MASKLASQAINFSLKNSIFAYRQSQTAILLLQKSGQLLIMCSAFCHVTE
jgi:hypothetical protein